MSKFEDLEHEKRNSDIVLENVDQDDEVMTTCAKLLILCTLKGTVIQKKKILKTFVMRNRKNKSKISIIAALSSEMDKKHPHPEKNV